jgi:hypothetical protein
MGRRQVKSKSENNDEEVEAKRTRHEDDEDKDNEEADESEESEVDSDEASVMTPNGVNKYIVRGYKNEMAGMDIPYRRKVHSEHGRLYKAREELAFIRDSTAACPTYGVCYWCFGSGPTNMFCQECRKEGHTYKTLVNDERTIIDAEWVSMFFGTTHLTAKADRAHNWRGSQPVQQVAIDDVKLFVHERWHDRNERADFRIGTWELFRDGLKWEASPQSDRCRSKTRQVANLIIEQEKMFNG